jgi:hypothetical protein
MVKEKFKKLEQMNIQALSVPGIAKDEVLYVGNYICLPEGSIL